LAREIGGANAKEREEAGEPKRAWAP
jgi:hypothetical protein